MPLNVFVVTTLEDNGSDRSLLIARVEHLARYARLAAAQLPGRDAVSFGSFLGIGDEEHAIPWKKLVYDTSLGGYRTDVTEQQLSGAPAYSRDRNYDWTDRKRDRELHDYWRAPYY